MKRVLPVFLLISFGCAQNQEPIQTTSPPQKTEQQQASFGPRTQVNNFIERGLSFEAKRPTVAGNTLGFETDEGKLNSLKSMYAMVGEGKVTLTPTSDGTIVTIDGIQNLELNNQTNITHTSSDYNPSQTGGAQTQTTSADQKSDARLESTAGVATALGGQNANATTPVTGRGTTTSSNTTDQTAELKLRIEQLEKALAAASQPAASQPAN